MWLISSMGPVGYTPAGTVSTPPPWAFSAATASENARDQSAPPQEKAAYSVSSM